jgi:signal transduction histidine kinase
MILLACKLLCSFLFAIGLLFIFIELITKFDKSILFGGIVICGLCIFSIFDIWILPNTKSKPEVYLFFTRAQNIFSFFLGLVMLYQISISAKTKLNLIALFFVAYAIVISALTGTDKLIFLENGEVKTTTLYLIISAPFVILVTGSMVYIIFKALRIAEQKEKIILKYNLAGILMIFSFGFFDLIIMATIGQLKLKITSLTIIGSLLYSIMLSFAFSKRLLILLSDRKNAYQKLETAYQDLASVGTLKQLGESTAIINHEIKNYMFAISSLTEQIRKHEPLTERGKGQIEDLGTTVNQLTRFSKNILSLSHANILEDKEKLDLSLLITDCINKRFSTLKDHFSGIGLEQPHFIYGDKTKLEQVLVNLFSNSLEAGSNEQVQIKIRFLKKSSVLLLIIEDNGIGCTSEQMKSLFTAFYTSKKGGKGNGLGLAITRTIIESHGGKISAYSKNLIEGQGTGMLMQLTFPFGEEKEEENGTSVFIGKENLSHLDAIANILRNVRINPVLVDNFTEIHKVKSRSKLNVLSADPKYISNKLWKKARLFKIIESDGAIGIIEENGKNHLDIFTEEFALKTL